MQKQLDDSLRKDLRFMALLIGVTYILLYHLTQVFFIGSDFALLAEQFAEPFTLFSAAGGIFAPAAKLVIAVASFLFGPYPAGYHQMMVVLHIVNVLLLFRVLRIMGSGRWVAGISALLWATLSQYSSVLYSLEGLTLILALLFALLSFLVFARWLEDRKPRYIFFSALLFLFALLSSTGAFLFLPLAFYYVKKKDYSGKDAVKVILLHLVLYIVYQLFLLLNVTGSGITGLINFPGILNGIFELTVFNIFGLLVSLPLIAIIPIVLVMIALGYYLRNYPVGIYYIIYLFVFIPLLFQEIQVFRFAYLSSIWIFPFFLQILGKFYTANSKQFYRIPVIMLVILFMFVSVIRNRIEVKDYSRLGELNYKAVEAARVYLQNSDIYDALYLFMKDLKSENYLQFERKRGGWDKDSYFTERAVGSVIPFDDLMNFCIHGNLVASKSGTSYKFIPADPEYTESSVIAGKYVIMVYTNNMLMELTYKKLPPSEEVFEALKVTLRPYRVIKIDD